MGILIHKDDDGIYIHFFQDDGPRDEETLRKFLECKRKRTFWKIR